MRRSRHKVKSSRSARSTSAGHCECRPHESRRVRLRPCAATTRSPDKARRRTMETPLSPSQGPPRPDMRRGQSHAANAPSDAPPPLIHSATRPSTARPPARSRQGQSAAWPAPPLPVAEGESATCPQRYPSSAPPRRPDRPKPSHPVRRHPRTARKPDAPD